MSARRTDDPPGFDPTEFRKDESTLKIGYKEASLSVKGVSVFLALGLLAIIGAILYSGWRTETTLAAIVGRIEQTIVATQVLDNAQHQTLLHVQDRTSCILTMTPERRDRFRDRYTPGAFKQECPWVSD